MLDLETQAERRLRLEHDKRVKALSKRIRKALEDTLQIARDEGCANPALYFESDGSIHVMDRDHMGDQSHSTRLNSIERQESVVFTLPDSTPPFSDVGAW